MKFKDPIRWEDARVELQADEGSRQFLAFFLKWFTEAETTWDDRTTTADWVRDALTLTEDETDTFLSMEWIGTALLLAREHWIYGEEMVRGLSRLEKRMLDQMEAVKLVELAESAKL